jgi:diguanylate cyclase (GGDEF)-like protein
MVDSQASRIRTMVAVLVACPPDGFRRGPLTTPLRRFFFTVAAVGYVIVALACAFLPAAWRGDAGFGWIVITCAIGYYGSVASRLDLGDTNVTGVVHVVALCALGFGPLFLVVPTFFTTLGGARGRSGVQTAGFLGNWASATVAVLGGFLVYHTLTPELSPWLATLVAVIALEIASSLYVASAMRVRDGRFGWRTLDLREGWEQKLVVYPLAGLTGQVMLADRWAILAFVLPCAGVIAAASWRRLLADSESARRRDAVTGIENRAALEERLAAATLAGERISVVMVDIDDFKHLNDTFGHQNGDLALRLVAEVLTRCTCPLDTTARYGGEEFAIILPGAGYDGACLTAERLRRECEIILGPWRSTVSVGVATGDAHHAAGVVLERADQALYQAKRSGKNQVCGGWESPADTAAPRIA